MPFGRAHAPLRDAAPPARGSICAGATSRTRRIATGLPGPGGATSSWALSLPLAALALGLIGLVMERVFLRPLGFDPLRQVLLTVGFAYEWMKGALEWE